MEVTEKDIFYYVFYPGFLDNIKLRYIEGNEEHYPALEVYNDIKNSPYEEISPGLKKKIADKIPDYKLTEIYELFPWTIEVTESNTSNSVLAAAVKTSSGTFSKTFIDKEKKIIIRLSGNIKSARLFVFPITGEKLEEFSLTFNPGSRKFYFKDSLETKIIEDVPEIHSISIEVYPP